MIQIYIRSWVYNVASFGWTALIAVVGLPTLLLPPQAACVINRAWGRGLITLLRVICNMHMEVRGREHLVEDGVIYASKHQSAWDTMAMWVLLHHPAYILKKELTYIPLFGLYLLKTGNVAIDRNGGMASLKQMLKDAAKHVSGKHPLIIYPEGTRTKPGSAPNYHTGVAALYSHLQVPVIPVALNSGVLWPKGAFLKRPGTVVIEFLPPIAPGLKTRAFMERLESDIETASNALLK